MTEQLNNIKQEKNSLKQTVKWNYVLSDGRFVCRADETNKTNMLLVATFSSSSENSFISTHEKCMNLFDSNDYPIIVVLTQNGGGYISLYQDLVRALAPNRAFFETGTFKISDVSDYLARTCYCSSNQDPYSCQKDVILKGRIDNLGDWYNKPTIIKYGNVEHKVVQISKYDMTANLKVMQKPRKPTEIVIYTDGYCFSACSMFVKNMKELAAVTVGFGGNPKTEYDDVFDDWESPTNVLESTILDYCQLIGFSCCDDFTKYATLRDKYGIYSMILTRRNIY